MMVDFKSILNEIGSGVIVLKIKENMEVSVLECNQTAMDMFGWKNKADIMSEPLSLIDFVVTEDYQMMLARINELMATGKKSVVDCRIRSGEGSRCWVICNMTLMEHNTAEAEWIVLCNFTDINERKKLEEDMQESYRMKYNDLLDKSKTGLVSGYVNLSQNTFSLIHDDTGYLKSLFNKNQNYSDIVYIFINYHRDEERRRIIKETLFPARLVAWFNSGHNDFVMEYETETPYGERIYLNVTINMMQNPHGDIEGIIMIRENSAKYVAAKIKELKKRTIFLNTFIIDTEKRMYALINAEADDDNDIIKSITRYDTQIEKIAEEIVAPEDKEKFLSMMNEEFIRSKLEESECFLEYIHYVRPDKSLGLSRYKFYYLDDNTRFIVGLIEDCEQEYQVRKELEDAFEQISETNKNLNETNRALQHASAAKSEFLAHISHDIRTPLNGVRGMLEIAEDNIENTDKLKDCLGKIRTSSDYLLALINDVLDMSKLEAGKVIFTREDMNIKEVINNIIGMLSNMAKENGVTINALNMDEMNIPNVFSSPLHFRQIMLNVISNAIKYNKPGGRIDLSINEISRTADEVRYCFVVEDTGIGMSHAFLEKIFEPFMQENESGNARTIYKGTGLGMSIVKNLVDGMHGDVAVSSEKGKGSTFKITLPFEINYQNTSVFSEQEEKIVDFSGLKVLVAEDNTLNLEIIEYVLKAEGMVVDSAEDGNIAVDKFIKSQVNYYDFILMDIMMPNKNGIDAVKEIRALEREDSKRVPIIAMTANAFAEDVQQTKTAGFNDHLAKPLDRKILKKTLAKYF